MARAIPFSMLLPEDVAKYIESIPDGQKAASIVAAIRASPGYEKFSIRSLAARRDQE